MVLLLLSSAALTEQHRRWLVLFKSRVPRNAHDWVVAAALERGMKERRAAAAAAANEEGGSDWQPCRAAGPCTCESVAALSSADERPSLKSGVPLSAADPTGHAALRPSPGSSCCELRCTVAILRGDEGVRLVTEDRQLRKPAEHDDPVSTRPGARRLLAGPLDVVRTLAVGEALWKRGARGQGVKIAVFDTGIARRHRHFRKSKVQLCINYTDQKTCEDGFGHGTFVSGLVISQEECLGMAPEAELYAFKVFTDKQVSYTSWFLDAFNHAIELGIDVLNLSIGGPDYMDQPFIEKVWEASANGIIIISAIGNDGPLYGTLNNPADQFDVLGVGGVTQGRRMASFSSRGMSTWELPRGYGRIKPDVVTYSELVRSSDHRGGCKLLSGTSVASPVVAGAVTGLVSLAKQLGRLHNPAMIKQVLVDSAKLIDGAGIYEQGAGLVNLRGAAALLEKTVQPTPSFLPRQLLLDDCPYMWPFCAQPLFHTGLPVVVNITVLNPVSRRATWASDPVWVPTNPGHVSLLEVATEQPTVVWPWSGWFAVSLRVLPAGRNFHGTIDGDLVTELDCDGQRHKFSLRIRASVIRPPPRGKRVLWDMFHNIQYPPGYVPRDDLEVTTDILDWNGDHPHTNFKGAFDAVIKAGYYVDILTSDFLSFDASVYSALLLIDTEEEFSNAEIEKLESDVKQRGLSVLVFAEWYNEELMQNAIFKDDNTGEWWTPATGGANIPALNDLLSPFGVAFSNMVYQGEAFLRRDRKALKYASGTAIFRFPAGGTIYKVGQPLLDQTERIIRQQVVFKKDVAILGTLQAGAGRIGVYGDSNCLDSAHSSNRHCYDLLVGLLQWTEGRGVPPELQRADHQQLLAAPWQAPDGQLPRRGEDKWKQALMKASHAVRGGGDAVRGVPHRVLPAGSRTTGRVAVDKAQQGRIVRDSQQVRRPPEVIAVSLPDRPKTTSSEGPTDERMRVASVETNRSMYVDVVAHQQAPEQVEHDAVITVPPPRPHGLQAVIPLLFLMGAVLLCCGVCRPARRRRRVTKASQDQGANSATVPRQRLNANQPPPNTHI
eukprot:Hpha_TRINITY_DN15276_c0_g4::TRINITY_DN15276_c0_g4_i1::g.66477::m.66477/K08653/MBTPS1; membrane-bound transcription factor site-1 protease